MYGQALHSRQVQSDTVLADTRGEQYLFKKDMVVMMPSGVSHTTPAAWGPNAGEFDAARFINWPETTTREQRAAFMPFGGGKHLCRGRNFATAEILGIVAALCLGTDIVQKRGRSAQRLVVPESVPAALGQAISKPKGHAKSEGLEVDIYVREGFEQVNWCFDS